METQTRYDLNAAIENWRAQLAAQPNLTPEVRRELETHLRDAIAGFQQRGLNDEESFWLACKRVGQPPELGEEFVKANPEAVWRERVFWMALGIMVFWQLSLLISDLVRIVLKYLTRGLYGIFDENGFWIVDMTVLVVGIILVRGWFLKSMQSVWLLKGRFQLMIFVAVLIFLTTLARMEFLQEVAFKDGHNPTVFNLGTWLQTFSHVLLGYLKFSVAPLIFLIWFFPKQSRKNPKHA